MKSHVLNDIKGQWKYQKTIYELNNKTINHYKQCINSSVTYIDEKIIINQNILFNKEVYANITVKQTVWNKQYNSHHIRYTPTIESSNQLNIIYENDFIQFQEKIYLINPNFFIIIGIMKQNNKYLSISFTSFIKIVS